MTEKTTEQIIEEVLKNCKYSFISQYDFEIKEIIKECVNLTEQKCKKEFSEKIDKFIEDNFYKDYATHSKWNMSKTLCWIKDVRNGCKKIIKTDLENIWKEIKKGNTEQTKFNLLLQEIRDNERDDALLFLIEEMLKEETKSEVKDD